MMKSLYSGVAGMKVHNQRMDVIGNNVSNVNTTGYKASNVTFKDVYYQTKGHASSGDPTAGGKNPTQIGYGAMLGTVTQVMSQSGFTYTDCEYDCAIEGEGFFQVMDDSGNIYYTRAGVFSVDSYGNLCDPNGNIVLGVNGDPSNVKTGQSQRINLHVPSIDDNKASCEKVVNGYGVEITADMPGEQGNIAFTIVNSATPYATRSGQTLTVYMDLDQEFGKTAYAELAAMTDPTDDDKKAAFNAAVQEFRNALNDAIKQGGVDLEEGVIPLEIAFDSTPPAEDVLAKSANNVLKLPPYTASGATDPTYLGIQFTANEPGAYANKYEIDMRASKDISNSVEAKWKGDVLTLTVPENMSALDDPIAAIQEAIEKAADGNPKKKLTVALVDATPGTSGGAAPSVDALKNYPFSSLEGNTERLGLENGEDNFFADLAVALSTVTLTDGRTASEQFVDDLETVQIDRDGTIYGRHAVHGLLALGRIDLVTFENPMGLDQVGTSMWRESLASGEAQVKIAGSDGAGKVISGAREMSNVDLAQEFSDMIITQRGYQANSRIITVSDTMLEELVNLKR